MSLSRMMLTIPLKVSKKTDLTAPLSTWLDASSSQPSSEECRDGLIRLSSARNVMTRCIKSPDGHAHAVNQKCLEGLTEYHTMLLECEAREFPMKDGEADELKLEWYSAFEKGGAPLIRSNLRYERLCVIFNIAALTSHVAVPPVSLTKETLTASVKHYSTSATLLHHLSKLSPSSDPNPSFDLTPPTLTLLKSTMLAQGQCCVYHMATLQPKPMHSVLAKIALGAAELYNDAVLQSQNLPLKSKFPDLERWTSILKVLLMLFRARSDWHESQACKEKNTDKMHGAEIARLTLAESSCEQGLIHARNGVGCDEALAEEVARLRTMVNDRKKEAQKDNEHIYHEVVPGAKELRAVKGQKMCKVGNKWNLPEALDNPLFAKLLSDRGRKALRAFEEEVQSIVEECETVVQEKTTDVRTRLAQVNLPQSLMAYANAGNGIPIELWNQIDLVQRNRSVENLKTELWHLQQTSSNARSTMSEIGNLLENDATLDREFRNAHPDFEGQTLSKVQDPIQKNLDQCEDLLKNAGKGDEHLAKTLNAFEEDAKFKLLQYDRKQLDFLIPSDAQDKKVDTSALSALLVELTNLIKTRESTLQSLKTKRQSIDFKSSLQHLQESSSDDEPDYENLLHTALRPFRLLQLEIHANIQKQPTLLQNVLHQNEIFLRQKHQTSSEGQNIPRMLQEALATLETLQSQLSEGKQFYDSITPRIHQLQQHAESMSVRLTMERCEYEDKQSERERRSMQETQDLNMAKLLAKEASDQAAEAKKRESEGAKKLAEDASAAAAAAEEDAATKPPSVSQDESSDGTARESNPPRSSSYNAGSYRPPSYSSNRTSHIRPGVVSVSNDKPYTPVDDEKVASLVEMGLEVDKVVRALEKYDNNVDQALNELLSC